MYITLGMSFYFFLFLAVAVILCLLLPLVIRIEAKNTQENNFICYLKFQVYIYGLKVLNVKKRVGNFKFPKDFFQIIRDELKVAHKDIEKEGRPGAENELKVIESKIEQILRLVGRFCRGVQWRRLDLSFQVGSGDPAWTGILTSGLRFLSGCLSSYLKQHLKFSQEGPRLLVYPSFFKKEFVFLLIVEFQGKVVTFLYFGLNLFIIMLSKQIWKKGRLSKCQNILFRV